MKKVFLITILIIVILLMGVGIYFRGYIIYFTTGKLTRSFCELSLTPKIWGITNQGHIYDLKYGYRSNGNLSVCASEMAYYTKNPKLCYQVVNAQEKDLCFFRIAEFLNQPDACNQIESSVAKTSCFGLFNNQ